MSKLPPGFMQLVVVILGTPRKKRRGIPGTKWIHIDQASYDSCRDYNEYRPPRS